MSGTADILAGYDSLRAGQEALYTDLHRHLELSHAEQRTAGRPAGQLHAPRIQAGFGIPFVHLPRMNRMLYGPGTVPSGN